jgi:hypothetical protein
MKKKAQLKGYTLEQFKARLVSDPAWTRRALVVLYSRQTEVEKVGRHTDENNGVGFSKFDAEFMSSLAQQINDGSLLSLGQMSAVQKKIGRYAKQLYAVALAKEQGHETSN